MLDQSLPSLADTHIHTEDLKQPLTLASGPMVSLDDKFSRFLTKTSSQMRAKKKSRQTGVTLIDQFRTKVHARPSYSELEKILEKTSSTLVTKSRAKESRL